MKKIVFEDGNFVLCSEKYLDSYLSSCLPKIKEVVEASQEEIKDRTPIERKQECEK